MRSEKKVDVRAERDVLVGQFENLTLEWAGMDPVSEEGRKKAAERTALVEKLAASYWKLDPYIRARTYYHRVGTLDEQGNVDYKGAAVV